MGVIAKQSIKGALANYLGVAIGFATTFFVLTDCLTAEEIGLTRVMVDFATLFSSLAQLGTSASVVRFFPYFRDDETHRHHGLFGLSLLIPLVGFTLFTGVFFLFRTTLLSAYIEKSPLLVDYAYLLIPLTFFTLYTSVLETNASVLLRIAVPKAVREVGIRLFNLISYLLYGHGIIDFHTFVLLFCLSYALAMLLDLVYLIALGHVSLRIDFRILHEHGRDLLRYTLFMTATVLASIVPLINTLFLGSKEGLALTGVYTIAIYIANIVEVPYRSLGSVSNPLVSAAVRDDDWRRVSELSRQVSLHQFLVASVIFLFIAINLQPLFRVIPHGAEYVGGIGVVLIMGVAKIVNCSCSVGVSVLNYSRRYAMSLPFIALLTVLAIVFNRLLIPLWGIYGSAAATLLSYLFYYLPLLLYVRKTTGVSIFDRSMWKVVVLVAMLGLLGIGWHAVLTPLLPSTTLWVVANGIVSSLLIAAVGVLLLRHLSVSPQVDSLLSRFLPLLKK
ncbi:MAG: lipopolysaccharide biosynthesis protein [Bacteroidales bacterium]|nr:lipopolysaccharide biosynthesis protein [Bacteroidales bacterium]MBQ9639879.1 lipopolysaccharide biosynthesis protein [Bacteroidales bacterium]